MKKSCSAVVVISGTARLTQDFCLLCSSLASEHCQLLSPACRELLAAGKAGARLESPGCGDLGYLLIVAHPTLPGLDAGGVSVLALPCGWRSCPSSGNRFCAFLALWFGAQSPWIAPPQPCVYPLVLVEHLELLEGGWQWVQWALVGAVDSGGCRGLR